MNSQTLIISLPGRNPEENRQFIIKALLSAQRWYIHTTDRHFGDEQDAVILMDLMQTLTTAKL